MTTSDFEKLLIKPEEFKLRQRNDPGLQYIFIDLSTDTTHRSMFVLENELLYYQKNDGSLLLVVPWDVVEKILSIYHNSDLSMHMSRDMLYATLRKRYFWDGVYADIRKWVNACTPRSRIKATEPKIHGLLVPIVTSTPFEMVGMDIMTPFKKSDEGYTSLDV
jgi:hypothetical protein